MKNMKEIEATIQVRISREADEKLVTISKAKNLTKRETLSRIVLFYHSCKLDMDLSYPNDLKNILRDLSVLNSKTTKIVGAVERTEDWIKCLVREERRSNPGSPAIDPLEIDASDVPARPSDDRFLQALVLLDRFFSNAAQTIDFEGRAAMQIRLSQSEFNKLKHEYDELCMLRSM